MGLETSMLDKSAEKVWSYIPHVLLERNDVTGRE